MSLPGTWKFLSWDEQQADVHILIFSDFFK